MKISPLASGGTPGTTLGNIELSGRSAPQDKMARAKAIAAGQTPQEPQAGEGNAQPQQPNVNRIKMHVNRTVDRDMQAALAAAQEDGAGTPEITTQNEPTAGQSSANPKDENGAVEATQPLSPQLAALAKQRRALQLERADLEKQKAELAANKPKDGSFVPADRLKSDPLGVLRELGALTPEFYNQAADLVMQGDGALSPEIHGLKQKIQELEQALDKKLNDRDTSARTAAESQIRMEAERLSQVDEFELVRETQSVPEVVRLISRTYDETGELLDTAEAMQLVEEDLLEQQKKLLNTKKLRGSLPQFQSTAQTAPQEKQLRTLTASGGATASLTAKQRALLAFQGQLKR